MIKKIKNYKEAIEMIEYSLQINPNHFDSLKTKGQYLQDQNQLEEAIIFYDKALTIQSNHQFIKIKKNQCLKALETKRTTYKITLYFQMSYCTFMFFFSNKFIILLQTLNLDNVQNPKKLNVIFNNLRCQRFLQTNNNQISQKNQVSRSTYFTKFLKLNQKAIIIQIVIYIIQYYYLLCSDKHY
ncbi:unnamed protein product [Paramecium octaurelia]|uniref:Tetratricopeptide repeat protein n=1 Tax=Paramecium octaurelia TaxID=43137 RepID=A0A8S1XPJ0_PAROT|nr:unnamed protein product [Paramecium octaurelia]